MKESEGNPKKKSVNPKKAGFQERPHGILFTPTLTKDQKVISEWNTNLQVCSYDEVEEFIRNKNLLDNSLS